ncbi:AraC family transcriptional regulator [Marinomonas sp. C2222]|uniref:AraC family transcriptional regulator n=1 Tax=Marinomonas sargassi TaxID=2984494 RepID=A0ABT2YRL2_9GAMM|nr:AraC family transcriptional regulator [Marinomonas sargassi]MCV2402395.1 AraC family transcriptional regulator [Marinomonas sargassi]
MKNWKKQPENEEVAKYVECYWFLEKEPEDNSLNYPQLNPDPSSHLIITPPDTVFSYEHKDSVQTATGSHWIFPHLKTFAMDHSSPFQIIGVKFKAGAFYSVGLQGISAPLDHISKVDIAKLLGSQTYNSKFFLEQITEGATHTCRLLDEALLPWLLQSHEDKHSRLVRQILPILADNAIAEMGDVLHRSQRTIERSFSKVMGMSMKQVQSMMLLESLLNDLYLLKDNDIHWADIASKHGFSDQPHLTRYLKDTIDNTPAKYAKQRNLTIDVYGDFEFD